MYSVQNNQEMKSKIMTKYIIKNMEEVERLEL